ncbi:uncharacterized protein B0H18DRAFT_957101 [Fomitopsis serialis]|uniref:uncharacterized protein n=1 Tax=Fomitopsis serialis TaxID=139415 RepID=UPI00200720DD|nr:uncharacterized protein B0H18DRAFT_957101 [Neoantrodia serialis]KAH9920398.1 hypothetical protein B0H18DRAFT_957101 [Neoantrodia serialis]
MDDTRSGQTSYYKRARLDDGLGTHLQTSAEAQDELLRMIEEGIGPMPSLLFELPDAGLPPLHPQIPDAPAPPVLGNDTATDVEAAPHPPPLSDAYLRGTFTDAYSPYYSIAPDGPSGLPSLPLELDTSAIGAFSPAAAPLPLGMSEHQPSLYREHPGLADNAPYALDPLAWMPPSVCLDSSATGFEFDDIIDYSGTAGSHASREMPQDAAAETAEDAMAEAPQTLPVDVLPGGYVGMQDPAEQGSDQDDSPGFARKLLDLARDVVHGICERLLADTHDAAPVGTSRTSPPTGLNEGSLPPLMATTAPATASAPTTVTSTITTTITVTIVTDIGAADAIGSGPTATTTTTTVTTATTVTTSDMADVAQDGMRIAT